MGAFDHARTLRRLQVWDGVVGRSIQAQNVTLSLLELAPDTHIPEHSHENEQLGILIEGSLRFEVGGESGDLEPGGTWCIEAHVPHSVTVGPDGAVVVEAFAPARADWQERETLEPAPGRWP